MNIFKLIVCYLKDSFDLFIPRTCAICDRVLVNGEKCICLHCLLDMPCTQTVATSNRTEDLFSGRVPFVRASSFFYYHKKGAYAELIHQLKYKNRPQIGVYLGRLYGYELLKTDYCKSLDYIIPIPLHLRRLRKRGYNQCEMIGKGLSEVTGVPMNTTAIIRRKYNKTQTKKSKTDRFSNVENLFSVVNPSQIEGKNILIIDDVITTGATIESFCDAILNTCNANIYIGSIALASDL